MTFVPIGRGCSDAVVVGRRLRSPGHPRAGTSLFGRARDGQIKSDRFQPPPEAGPCRAERCLCRESSNRKRWFVDSIEVIFVDEHDPEVTPLGAKGMGEIGIVSTAAAVANAMFHATGNRVRSLPITIDKLS